jgi:hypothetical protein
MVCILHLFSDSNESGVGPSPVSETEIQPRSCIDMKPPKVSGHAFEKTSEIEHAFGALEAPKPLHLNGYPSLSSHPQPVGEITFPL